MAYLYLAGTDPNMGSITKWVACASARQESSSNEKLNAFSCSFTIYTVCSAGKFKTFLKVKNDQKSRACVKKH